MPLDTSNTKGFVTRPIQVKDGQPARHASSVNDPSIQPPINPEPTLHALHKLEKTLYSIERFPIWTLLRFYQEIFNGLERWAWTEESKTTNLFIIDKYPEGLDESEMKPAIVTDRGPIRLSRINGRGRNKRVNVRRKLVEYGDLVECQVTIHCLSKVGLETGELAGVVFGGLVQLEDDLKLRGIHAVLEPTMQPEGEFITEAEYEFKDTPVTLTVQFGWAWARRFDGAPFTKLGASIECGAG